MSGIVGILNLEGAPVDRRLLEAMTTFMVFRGPDARRTWVDGSIGFGHTLLQTSEESARESQPFTIDGSVWIVADARVDARAELIAKISAHGQQVEPGTTDVELLLRAYLVWGEDCVDHLLGDFAFAVWDSRRHHLFCARDHLGIKPLYYASFGTTVVFSNTLDCVRQHPSVPETLNDEAIADFLLFGLNQDSATTSFAQIQQLPPAHRATWRKDGLTLNRYWTLPIDEPVYLKRPEEYTERLLELLDLAVRDRLRTEKVSLFMSGGLDSPTLAATAHKLLRGTANSEVRAFTTVVDGLDGNERHYAGLVARHLGIPIHFRDRSTEKIDPCWHERKIHTPEPVVDPTNLQADREEFQAISRHSRILFYGEGPDNALRYEWKASTSYLATKGKFAQLAVDVCRHVIHHRRLPLLTTVPRILKAWVYKDPWRTSFPEWLDPDFESRMNLRARWESNGQSDLSLPAHPARPRAYRSFHKPLWQSLFSSLDAGEMMAPLETRHPYLDLRLLRYMLSVPAIPWCREKYLYRRAMRGGTLPDELLGRPKTPLKTDPLWECGKRSLPQPLTVSSALHQYVNWKRVPKETIRDMVAFRTDFRPLALSYWLSNMRQEQIHFLTEG